MISYLETSLNEIVWKNDIGMKTLQSMDGFSIGSSDTIKFSSVLNEPDIADFSDPKTLYGLSHRIVAAESCWFATKVSIFIIYFLVCSYIYIYLFYIINLYLLYYYIILLLLLFVKIYSNNYYFIKINIKLK